MTAKAKRASRKPATPSQVPTFSYQPTTDEHLFRVVDRYGDWTVYWQDEWQVYLPAVNHVISTGFPKGQRFYEWLKNKSSDEVDHILKTAGERGTKVHRAISDLTDGKTVTIESKYKNDNGMFELISPDEWDCLISWMDWAKQFKPTLRMHESAISHRLPDYAGTIDFLGDITIDEGQKVSVDDKVVVMKQMIKVTVLLDYKTGSGIYDDHKLQVASYAHGLDVKDYPDFTGILRVGTKHTKGYELKLWGYDKTQYHFQQFCNAYSIFEMNRADKWEPQIELQPTSLSIKLPTK